VAVEEQLSAACVAALTDASHPLRLRRRAHDLTHAAVQVAMLQVKAERAAGAPRARVVPDEPDGALAARLLEESAQERAASSRG
jgi:hypothetical protein